MFIRGKRHEFIIKDTHRGLWYEDGKLVKVLEAGRYEIPPQQRWLRRLPKVECLLVDVRQRELTIKGQEILTADKVAIRRCCDSRNWKRCATWRRTAMHGCTLASIATDCGPTRHWASTTILSRQGEPIVPETCPFPGNGGNV